MWKPVIPAAPVLLLVHVRLIPPTAGPLCRQDVGLMLWGRERRGGELSRFSIAHRKEFLQIIRIITSWTFPWLPGWNLRLNLDQPKRMFLEGSELCQRVRRRYNRWRKISPPVFSCHVRACLMDRINPRQPVLPLSLMDALEILPPQEESD